MIKVLLLIFIFVNALLPVFSQDNSYYSSHVTTARCGSANSGTTNPIENHILISESDNFIAIYFEDGGQVLSLEVTSVKHSDAVYGITEYVIQPNNSGIHTVLLDVDEQRKLLIFLRKDKVCTFYGPLRGNK